MSAKLKIVISMAVFGTLALFVKNISLQPGEIALFRALIASTAIILYKALTAEKLHFARIKNELNVGAFKNDRIKNMN